MRACRSAKVQQMCFFSSVCACSCSIIFFKNVMKHLDTNVKPYLIKLIISVLPYINTNEEVKKNRGWSSGGLFY